ncbi:MAG: hypothetical protein HZA50_15280, partial [Planctomycetes bacterium]|nr:hypothetical protein [Planctomycetota bacterium]
MTKHKTILLAAVLLVCPAGLYARGGGGCLEQDTIIVTPAGPVKVQDLSLGMKVRTFIAGRSHDAAVIAATQVQPDCYVELTLPDETQIRLTAEHPVAVSQDEFIQAGLLKAGDAVVVSDGSQGLKQVNILGIRRISTGKPAYNLLVAPGGTFLAGPLLVHNKGCFLPDTPIARADGSSTLISVIRPGDSVLAFQPDGRLINTTVRKILAHQAEVFLIVRTAEVELRVTEEHPFFIGRGRYKIARAIKVGDEIFAWDGQKGLTSQKVLQITPVSRQCTVYNLQTDDPHTFFAAGIAVHNKGGGSSSHSSGSSRSGSSGPETWFDKLIEIIGGIFMIIVGAVSAL